MSRDGWSSWGEPRNRTPDPEITAPGDLVRYCPRCDSRTLWRSRGDGVRECSSVGCGITVTTILKPAEVGRLRKHYARSL